MLCHLILTLIKWLVNLICLFRPLVWFVNLSRFHFSERLQSTSRSLSMLVREVLLNKKPEEVPMVRNNTYNNFDLPWFIKNRVILSHRYHLGCQNFIYVVFWVFWLTLFPCLNWRRGLLLSCLQLHFLLSSLLILFNYVWSWSNYLDIYYSFAYRWWNPCSIR